MNKKSLFIFGGVLIALLAAVVLIAVFAGGPSSKPSNSPATQTPAPITEKEYSAMCITVSAGANAHTSKNFCWQTFDDYKAGAIQYGEITDTQDAEAFFNNADSQNIITVNSATEPMSLFLPVGESNLKNPPLEEKEGLVHRVWLKELTPGKTYAYRVGDKTENKWSEAATFTTVPESKET